MRKIKVLKQPNHLGKFSNLDRWKGQGYKVKFHYLTKDYKTLGKFFLTATA